MLLVDVFRNRKKGPQPAKEPSMVAEVILPEPQEPAIVLPVEPKFLEFKDISFSNNDPTTLTLHWANDTTFQSTLHDTINIPCGKIQKGSNGEVIITIIKDKWIRQTHISSMGVADNHEASFDTKKRPSIYLSRRLENIKEVLNIITDKKIIEASNLSPQQQKLLQEITSTMIYDTKVLIRLALTNDQLHSRNKLLDGCCYDCFKNFDEKVTQKVNQEELLKDLECQDEDIIPVIDKYTKIALDIENKKSDSSKNNTTEVIETFRL